MPPCGDVSLTSQQYKAIGMNHSRLELMQDGAMHVSTDNIFNPQTWKRPCTESGCLFSRFTKVLLLYVLDTFWVLQLKCNSLGFSYNNHSLYFKIFGVFPLTNWKGNVAFSYPNKLTFPTTWYCFMLLCTQKKKKKS